LTGEYEVVVLLQFFFNVLLGYNKVRIDLSTHALNGLTENDFIMAMKIDSLGQGA